MLCLCYLTASQFFKKNEGCLINIPAADILYNYSSSCLSRSIFSVPALFLQRHVCILLSVDSKFSYFIYSYNIKALVGDHLRNSKKWS